MSGFLGGLLESIGVDPTPRGLLDAPVGTSTMQRVTNPSPQFSPLISPGLLSNEQKLGLFWNLATRQAKPYTNRDLPQLSAAGNEAYDAAAGFVGMTTPIVKGIRAFHGSPHTFDRFDLSKIGTGEGAQAYGHGLYFAGNENVARTYKAAGQPVYLGADRIDAARKLLDAAGGDRGRAMAQADEMFRGAKKYSEGKLWQDVINNFDELTGKGPGSMYEVSLRTSPDRLLDWDKPLSQQPAAVREVLKTVADPYGYGYGLRPQMLEMPGGDFYRAQAGKALAESPKVNGMPPPGFNGYAETARAMKDAGLDGIQYLDAGSRAAGDGSRNYVMFDDKLIDILRRYGLLGMIGGGAAATVGAPEQ